MRQVLVLLGLHWLALQGPASASVTNRLADGLPGALADWAMEEPASIALTSEMQPHADGGASAPQVQPLDVTPDPSWVDVSIKFNVPFDELHPLDQRLTYGFMLSNAGPATATSVILTNPIPAALVDPAVTVSQGNYSITNQTLRWEAGTLAAGATAEVALEVTPISVGQTAITASVRPAEWDYKWVNNSGTTYFTLGQADLGLTVQQPPDEELQAGVPFQLSVVVTNHGPDQAAPTLYSSGNNDFIVVNYFLSQGQVEEFQEGGFPCSVYFGELPAHGTARLVLTLIPKRSGTLTLTSSVTSEVPEPEEGFPNSALASLLVGAGQGILEFGAGETNVLESVGQALLAVMRHDGSAGTVQVSYATQDGSAVAGRDYVAVGGTLTFLAGETSKTIAVPLINNTQTDCNRQLSVRLSNATGGALLYGATNLTLSILEDDLIPSGELAAVSLSTNGLDTATGPEGSALPSISADGRWVAFASDASDLVASDANGTMDVFVRDLLTGETQLVSVNATGNGSGNGASSYPVISADGRWVAFGTEATDLVTNAIPTNTTQTVVRDLLTGETQLASVTPQGTGAEGQSVPAGLRAYNQNPTGGISSNGQMVLFLHDGRGLIAGNTNQITAYFVRDLAAQTTRLVTMNKDGTGPSTGDIYPEAALSANGRRVVLRSKALDLVEGFNNGAYHVYVRDLVSNTTIPVDVNYTGGPSLGAGQAVISADGRYVAFTGDSNQLVSDDDNPNSDIFVRDVDAGVTYRASAGLYAICNTPSLSADGRFVAFRKGASTGPVPVNDSQVYVRDCWSNHLALVSVNCLGDGPADRHARNPVISSDGRQVVFQSFATDLVPGTFANSIVSLYRRDLTAGETVLISINRALTGGPANPSGVLGSIGFSYPALSADGTVVGFASNAEDLVWGDGNHVLDVFVWRTGYPYRSGPSLQIDRQEDDVVLHWSRGVTNFILQSALDLSGLTWTNVAVTTTNELRFRPVGQGFFRLKAIE